MRRDSERGAAAVLVAVFMSVVLIVAAAIAVDLGMQRVVRADAQAVADVVALDAARLLDGRTAGQIRAGGDGKPSLAQAVERSAARNATALGDMPEPPRATLVFLDPGPNGEQVARREAGAIVEVPDGEVPDAVHVAASGSVAFAFAPGSGSATRDAVATSVGGACFSIGSYAARLNTDDSPLLGTLLGALGTDITLGVGDYNALASAEVNLVALLGADLGAGTFEELLDLGVDVPLADLYLATADLLRRDEATAAAQLLESIAAEVGGVTLGLGEILNLGTGTARAGLDAALNVFDLVTAAALAATGDNAVSIPELKVDLGPLADVAVNAHVTQPPQVGCGRKGEATATTSQVGLTLSSGLANLDLGLVSTKVRLNGSVDVAAAEGVLTDIRCAPPGITVDVRDGLINVALTLQVKIDAVFGLLPVIDVPVTISGTSPPSGQVRVDVTDGDYNKPGTGGHNNSGLPWLDVDTSKLKLLGIPLGILTDWVVDPLLNRVVNPLIQGLDQVLLSPLLRMLGLSLSGADVYAKPVPVCDAAFLIG